MPNNNLAEKEFERLFEQYSDSIFRHCLFKVSHRETALDIMQETFKRVWLKIIEGEKLDNQKAFCFRIANNLIIDFYRKSKAISLDSLEVEPAVEKGELNPSEQADLQIAIETIKSLGERYREAVLLRYVEGFSVKEIAEISGESENVISVRINRGLSKVKEIINPEV